MIDAGTSTVPDGLADIDVYRTDRVIGAKVDIGAAESPVDGTGFYVVTNTSASGAGSLSAAITLANSDPADNVITFNIPGNCPHRITVATGLEVRDQLLINGYSQPGSSRNTSEAQWNGVPCIILDGVNNSGTGIITGGSIGANNEGVEIVGLAFERFDAAILLSLGRDHRVLGNQFGGRVGASGPILRANSDSIFLLGENSVIGGLAPRDINLIGGATGAGVVITGASTRNNVVTNNIIGIDKNGISRLPNEDGVDISARENLVSFNRIGGNTRDGVVLRGSNAYGNQVTFNYFGNLTPSIVFPLAGNDRMGILVDNNAHDNRIGPNNTIGSNVVSGVRISSTSGGRNSIAGNTIGNNGLGIDLDSTGVTPNSVNGQACDLTLGCAANGKQNYPVLIDAVINPGGLVPIDRPLRVQGTLRSRVGGPYRVEFYANDSCNSSGFGEGQRFLGSVAVSVTFSGICTPSPANCTASFSTFFPTLDASLGDSISALTVAPNGDTSEFSSCVTVVNGPPMDDVFKNGFE